MAPPRRSLRPHLTDLLQKNHDLEHTVADLRHQLTESSAKWADERKALVTGCDAFMASFAKFRSRLDKDWREVDEASQSENEADDVGDGKQPENDSNAGDCLGAGDPHKRCSALVSELRAQVEQLEEAQRNVRVFEEELGRVNETHDSVVAQLQARIDQLQESLTTAIADGARSNIDSSPQQTPPDDIQVAQAETVRSELKSIKDQLVASEEEVARLKLLLMQWRKYVNDRKREATNSYSRVAELESREGELTERLKALEGDRTLLGKERKETERLANTLSEQVTTADNHRIAREEATNRIAELEEQVALLQAQRPPARSDATQQRPNQPERMEQGMQTRFRREIQHNARPIGHMSNEMIVPTIPFQSQRKNNPTSAGPSGSVQTPENWTSASVPASSSMNNRTACRFHTSTYEVCIHTCNPSRCRNNSGSFLWLRRSSAISRHALSRKKHLNCTPDCPGHNLLCAPSAAKARSARCRRPTEEEISLAMKEVQTTGLSKFEVEEMQEDRDRIEEDDEADEEGENEELRGEAGASDKTFDGPLGKRKRAGGDDESNVGVRKLRSRPSQIK